MSNIQWRQRVSGRKQTCCPTFDLLGCGTLIHGAVGDCLFSVVVAVTCSSSHTHSSKALLTLTQACSCHAQSAANRRPAKEKDREEKPESQQVIKMSLGRTTTGIWSEREYVAVGSPGDLLKLHKAEICSVFTINSMVFKEISQQSRNILNHSAQAPASAAVPTLRRDIIQHKPSLSGIASAHFTVLNSATVWAASESH